jgi:DNA-binding Lrp family transcriptional regulator
MQPHQLAHLEGKSMPTPPMSDVIGIEALDALARNNDNYADAARELGIVYTTLYSRVKKAKERGLHLSDGARNSMSLSGLNGAEIKGGWIAVLNDEGEKIGNNRWSVPKSQEETNQFLDTIRGAMDDLKTMDVPEYEIREKPDGECLLVIDLADIHVGKLCVSTETGYTYSREVAVTRMIEGTRELIRKASGMGIGRILFVIGNDILHVDNARSSTTSGTQQDTHGTIHQIARDGFGGYVGCIELARLTAPVDIIYIPSNHDWLMGWCLAQQLGAWFRNAPDVTATEYNLSELHRKYYRFEGNLIGLTHGDGAKETDLYPLMMTEARAHISDCVHRYWYVHHLHHKIRKQAGVLSHKREKDHIGMTMMHNAARSMEGDNVQIEYVRSMSPPDGWHDRNGYVNRQAVECFVHHPHDGQDGRFTVWF